MPLATQYKTKEMEEEQRYVRSRLMHLDETKDMQMDERDYVYPGIICQSVSQ